MSETKSKSGVAVGTPTFEMPEMLREFAEKGAAQAKETYEKAKGLVEEANVVLEETCAKASKGYSEYGLKLIEVSRANSNAAYDYFSALVGPKSVSEIVELSTKYARERYETLTMQGKDLAALTQKLCADTAEPFKTGVTSAFGKAA